MKKFVYIIISLWFLIVSFAVISQEYTLHNGKEILLKTFPVDPRDLLRGDYVIFNYEIAQVPSGEFYRYNTPVYLSLALDKNNIAYRTKILTAKPDKGLFIKGKIAKCPTTVPLVGIGKCVNMGIESYFVKEKTGLELERNLRKGAFVRVKIDKNGNAKVIGFVK